MNIVPEKRFAGESDAYRRLRNELLEAEGALKDQRERVAELRRQLPLGAPVTKDYVFREGPGDLAKDAPGDVFDTHLAELFAPGKDSLIVAHVMFGATDERGCPMCGMWVDGYNRVLPYVSDLTNFVVVAKKEIGALRAWARDRGWDQLRLLSSHDNDFNADHQVEQDGHQLPGLSVFLRRDGAVHHWYTTEGSLVFRHHRAMDLFSPVWHLFDLLPEGRGDWFPKHAYG